MLEQIQTCIYILKKGSLGSSQLQSTINTVQITRTSFVVKA